MRAYHKGWQNKRPGWTRRVRWLQGPDDIRLEFTDETGKCNRIYKTKEEATVDYERFIAGTSGDTIWNEGLEALA